MKKKKELFTPKQTEELWKIISNLNVSQGKDSIKDAIALGKEKIKLLENFVEEKENILYALLSKIDGMYINLDLGDDSFGDFIEVCISKGKLFFEELVTDLIELRKKNNSQKIEEYIKEKCKDFIESPDEMGFSVLWQIDWDVVANPMDIVKKYSKTFNSFKIPKIFNSKKELFLTEDSFLTLAKLFIINIKKATTIEEIKLQCSEYKEYNDFRNMQNVFEEKIKNHLTYNEYKEVKTTHDYLFVGNSLANFINDVKEI